MALDRDWLWIKDNGNPGELVVGVQQTVIVEFKDRTGALIDLTGQALAVAVKTTTLGTPASIAATITAQANQATTGKGQSDLLFPSAELTTGRIDLLAVDVRLNSENFILAKVNLKAAET